MTRGQRFFVGIVTLALVMCLVSTAQDTTGANATVTIDVSQARPRQVEEATQQAIVRDYAKAWQTMAQALDQNRPELLNASFTGFARDRLAQAVDSQNSNGLKRRYVDRGHKLEVDFYSLEGSALQVRDTAQVEIQHLDGDRVVHSERTTLHYIALLTPTETSWKVRMLQAVPGF